MVVKALPESGNWLFVNRPVSCSIDMMSTVAYDTQLCPVYNLPRHLRQLLNVLRVRLYIRCHHRLAYNCLLQIGHLFSVAELKLQFVDHRTAGHSDLRQDMLDVISYLHYECKSPRRRAQLWKTTNAPVKTLGSIHLGAWKEFTDDLVHIFQWSRVNVRRWFHAVYY